MIILNFKTYPESTGEGCKNLLNIVDSLKNVNLKFLEIIYSAPSIIDLIPSKEDFKDLNFISQFVDNKPEGKSTGSVTPENLLEQGIQHSIYNHSENRIPHEELIQNIRDIQSRGIKLIVCCENISEAEKILEAEPYGIAYEAKDLIGTGNSVTSRPEIITEFIEKVGEKTMAFIGAGVTNAQDILKGKELGAEGFILSSGFVKSDDPKTMLIELANAFVQ